MPSADLDNDIRARFGSLISIARDSPTIHHTWTENPNSALALLLLLDQFPRNIFRGSPQSYSSDLKALGVATWAIAKGFDRQVPPIRQLFFYLPFMHDELLLSQVAGKALYENCRSRCGDDVEAKKFVENEADWAQKHMDVIQRFGRFPARNQVLGRESTREELEFLKENPRGF